MTPQANPQQPELGLAEVERLERLYETRLRTKIDWVTLVGEVINMLPDILALARQHLTEREEREAERAVVRAAERRYAYEQFETRDVGADAQREMHEAVEALRQARRGGSEEKADGS